MQTTVPTVMTKISSSIMVCLAYRIRSDKLSLTIVQKRRNLEHKAATSQTKLVLECLKRHQVMWKTQNFASAGNEQTWNHAFINVYCELSVGNDSVKLRKGVAWVCSEMEQQLSRSSHAAVAQLILLPIPMPIYQIENHSRLRKILATVKCIKCIAIRFGCRVHVHHLYANSQPFCANYYR